MKKKILVYALLISLITTLIPTAISTPITTSASPTESGWTLVTEARAMKAYPDLHEYIWEKNATMPPNGPYNIIGLHRLIKQGITPKGVFLSVSASSSNGEATISNPPTDSFVKSEDSYPPIYWANRGFDVYYMDQRSHFVPSSLNASQLSFMANWGWDQWISDMREVVLEVKEISGAQKIFIASGGNEAPLNYATLYPNDLAGIIMLEPSLYGIRASPVAVKRGNETNTYNLTKEIASMNSFGNWSTQVGGWSLFKSAADNPEAPVNNATATALGLPLINPITNRTWTNVTELSTFLLNYAYGSNFPGALSNTYGGYGNATVDIRFLSQADRYGLPARLKLESQAMADWINCPYVTHDFDDNWDKINVPLICFSSQLYSNMTGTFRFVNGIGTADFTGVVLPKYGQLDAVLGTYAAKDVYQPTLDWMINHSTSGWTLVTDARAMKAYPDLKEYVWQKNATMPPNGQYDIIGLHRLVKTGTSAKGVVFICPRVAWSGEAWISNPATDNFTKNENNSQPIYWANRGFDVYAIDYRTHFVPSTLNNSQRAFMQNWTYALWISDIKEAVDKTKEVSEANKVFMVGPSNGGGLTVMYATKYWQDDLRGIILLDALIYNGRTEIVAKNTTGTNTYNLTKAVNDMISAGTWSTPSFTVQQQNRARYALANPRAPAEDPPGTPLTPTINPLTNKTWSNITEWFAYTIETSGAGNTYDGYSNVTEYLIHTLVAEPFFSARMSLESLAMADWTNCPYVPYDFDDHFKEINVPLLAFASGPLYSNKTGTFQFVNGINNTDFTTIMLPKYGHTDVYMGTYSARDVSQPALDWMVNRLPTLTFGNTNVGAYQDGNDGQAKSASYFKCNNTGLVTDIFAYVARLGEAGDGAAAIYADNAGSPGALIAVTDEAIVGTDFSWVDFPLLSPVNVTAGMGYWLAVSSNNNLNMKIVMGSGVRVHNGVSSWFSDPFGSVWGTHDAGSMSIYAKGTTK